MLFQYIHLHYVHCISASSRLFKTPSAGVIGENVEVGPVTAGRAEVALVGVVAAVRLTRPIAPAVNGPIEFSRSI